MLSRSSVQLPVAAVAIVLSSCSGDDASSSGIAVQDSAGVEVVTVGRLPARSDSAAAWSLHLLRQIPGGGGLSPTDPIALYNPSAAVRFPDGALAVYDKGPERIVVLDSSNTVAARFAPPGRGPGEIYGDGVALLAPGVDTLLIVERWGNTRIHRFTRTGELISDHPVARISGAPWGPAPSGAITVPVWTSSSRAGQPFVDSLARLYVRDGSIETFAELPPRFVAPAGENPLFYPIQLWTSFPTGWTVIGTTHSGRFRVHRPDGSLERIINLPISPAPVTEESARRVMEEHGSFLASVRTGEDQSEQFYSYHRMAMRLFTYDDTTFAMAHSWLSQPSEDGWTSDEAIFWRFFDINGTPRGIVSFPDGFRPWDVSDRVVYGVWTDSLGVPEVRLYRLEPPGG